MQEAGLLELLISLLTTEMMTFHDLCTVLQVSLFPPSEPRPPLFTSYYYNVIFCSCTPFHSVEQNGDGASMADNVSLKQFVEMAILDRSKVISVATTTEAVVC